MNVVISLKALFNGRSSRMNHSEDHPWTQLIIIIKQTVSTQCSKLSLIVHHELWLQVSEIPVEHVTAMSDLVRRSFGSDYLSVGKWLTRNIRDRQDVWEKTLSDCYALISEDWVSESLVRWGEVYRLDGIPLFTLYPSTTSHYYTFSRCQPDW